MIFDSALVVKDGRRRMPRRLCKFGFGCRSARRAPRGCRTRSRARTEARRPSVIPQDQSVHQLRSCSILAGAPKNLTWGAVAGIAISPSDQIWTFNRGPVPVQVYTADGELVRSWGEGQFREPHQVRIDRDGFVWLVDSSRHVVKKFTPEGKLLLTLGTDDEPGEDSTHFNRPTDVAIARNGHVFVADGYGNNRIVHFNDRGQFVGTWGSLGSAPGQFSLPHSIALDSRGRLFVADRNNARVQVFDQAGRFLDEWRDLSGSLAHRHYRAR